MKFFVIVCVLVFSCVPVKLHADEVKLEGGFGFHESRDSLVSLFRYQKDTSPLFGFASYYDLSLATWSGPTHNNAIVLMRGVRWFFFKEAYIDFEAGGAYLSRTTENLGTRVQFAFRGAFGCKYGPVDVSLGYRHFSNGKGVFMWAQDKPNHGENFITFQVGYVF